MLRFLQKNFGTWSQAPRRVNIFSSSAPQRLAWWVYDIIGDQGFHYELKENFGCTIITLGQNFNKLTKFWPRHMTWQLSLKVRTTMKRKLLKQTKITEKHPKFSNWFRPNQKKYLTRRQVSKYSKVFVKTKRFEKQPPRLPYIFTEPALRQEKVISSYN